MGSTDLSLAMRREGGRHRPEDFLAFLERSRRGRVKVYIGFAAGVGKTYRMLEEARLLKSQGVDVVLGRVETHGRSEVATLAEGFEQVPLRVIAYRGLSIVELDCGAVLERKPQVVLIDDLAHTNAPGSLNRRRYQDVLQIADAGINVLCSFNIQHLESLKEVVDRVTGVRVRETVPDSFLRAADQVVNIDLTSEDLLERLRAGKVLPPDRVEYALSNFFRPQTLATLRELALRQVAETLERASAKGWTGDRPLPKRQRRNRLMVCVSPFSPLVPLLLLRGARLAGRLNTDWVVASVEDPDDVSCRADPAALRQLETTIDNAKELGATLVRLEGRDPVETLLQFAEAGGFGHVMVGRSQRSGWERLFSRSFASRIIRRAEAFDVHLVSLTRDDADR